MWLGQTYLQNVLLTKAYISERIDCGFEGRASGPGFECLRSFCGTDGQIFATLDPNVAKSNEQTLSQQQSRPIVQIQEDPHKAVLLDTLLIHCDHGIYNYEKQSNRPFWKGAKFLWRTNVRATEGPLKMR